MNRIIVILAVTLLFSDLNAQDKENKTYEGFKGRKALCFSIDGLDLDAYNGGVGGKKWISDDFVLFASLNIAYSKTEDKNSNPNDYNTDSYSYGVSAGFEKHFSLSKRQSPFLGLSIGNKLKNTETNSMINNVGNSEDNINSRFYECDFIGGMEFLLSRDISLSAQYNIGLIYTKLTTNHTIDDVVLSNSENSKTTFGINSVLLTLSFYF
ncbi:hypothetical protein ACFL6O_04545 [candidate division KSB1 bacterium]